METKIILNVKDNEASVEYEPALDATNFNPYINSALNCMPKALLDIFSTVPLLRPASSREQELHAYVFNEGDLGDTENKLYKFRKHLYDTTVAVFSQVLSTAFPDIEYIEICKQYQQSYCVDNPKEDVDAYKKDLEELAKYVRENFQDILKEVTEEKEADEDVQA